MLAFYTEFQGSLVDGFDTKVADAEMRGIVNEIGHLLVWWRVQSSRSTTS